MMSDLTVQKNEEKILSYRNGYSVHPGMAPRREMLSPRYKPSFALIQSLPSMQGSLANSRKKFPAWSGSQASAP